MPAVDQSGPWEQIQLLFDELIELDPEARARRLDELYRNDPAGYAAVVPLLDAFDEAGDFMGLLDDPGKRPDQHPPRSIAATPLQEGTMVHAYRIIRELGRGGMGEVYLAQDRRLDRLVALKFVSPHLSTSGEARERLYTEARAAAALDHPNIATVFEIGEAEAGTVFIAMAYYEGQTLKERIAQGPLSVDEALDIATQVATGLAAAHRKDIIHRDIKPANIVCSDAGPVKILDFGLAKRAGHDLTQGTRTMGTVAYMSPEQIQGEVVDHRTDLWSLGAVLYEMLSGRHAFEGEREASLLHAILHHDPAPLRSVRADLPADVEKIVGKALSKRREARYQDAGALLQDLQRVRRGDAVRFDPEPAHTGTVTFFYSDIESATQLLRELGASYGEVQAELKRLLRAALQATGGREVDSPGDSFFAVFGKASNAVAAAVTVQRIVAAHAWPGGATISVRTGLHTGEPLVHGDSYVGLDVHRTARICAAAHGGQVLLSQVTCELAGHELPEGVRAVDLGLYRLPDFPAPERLFQLVITGQPSHFPPLRVQGSWQANLPAPLTELVGRERELQQMKHLVREQGRRLLTLTGPGGTGKTRLAVHLAADVAADFEDGVCFVSLAPIAEASLVASAVAHALGVREVASGSLRESLLAFLQDKHGLLVLDNFEHVIEAAELVAEWLSSCPFLTILVTSRAPLHLQGEYEVPVPPLAVPDASDLLPEQMVRSASVALFVARAQAVQPGFTLNAENVAAVGEICTRLDGLPLAIELAAARVKVLSPRALVTRLQHRFDLLEAPGQDRPARHRTLREAIAWSYELLSGPEQALFRRLGVFAGGCSEIAQAACCGDACTAPRVLSMLASLVDKSLLGQEEGPDGEPRFIMLETIREYALDRLRACGEEADTRRQHLGFFLQFAENAAQQLTGPDQAVWFDRLEREHNNFRAALTFALSERSEAAARLAVALCRFWLARGFVSEGYQQATNTLAVMGHSLSPMLRAHLLMGTAMLAADAVLFPAARDMLREALVILRQEGHAALAGEALNHLSWNHLCMGDHGSAQENAQEALALYRALDHARGVGVALNNLGFSSFLQGDYGTSAVYFEESAICCRKTGDLRSLTRSLANLAYAYHYQGYLEKAEALQEEAVATAERTGDPLARAICHNRLVLIRFEQGKEDAAIELLNATLPLFRASGYLWGLLACLNISGYVLLQSGAFAQAQAVDEELLHYARRAGAKPAVALVLCRRGERHYRSGDVDGAEQDFLESLQLRREMDEKAGTAECLEGLARIALDQQRGHRAAVLLGAAETIREAARAAVLPRRAPGLQAFTQHLRTALGEEAFSSARTEGRQMTVRDAADYGLHGRYDVLSSTPDENA